jgi:hypothetical protein
MIEHSPRTLIRQRVFGIALGYEDLDEVHFYQRVGGAYRWDAANGWLATAATVS